MLSNFAANLTKLFEFQLFLGIQLIFFRNVVVRFTNLTYQSKDSPLSFFSHRFLSGSVHYTVSRLNVARAEGAVC